MKYSRRNQIEIEILVDLLWNLESGIMALSLVNGKLVVGHDFARSSHNMMLNFISYFVEWSL